VTTRAEVPAGVGPGAAGPGPTDELPPTHEETSRASRIAAAGKRNGNLTRQLRRVAIKLATHDHAIEPSAVGDGNGVCGGLSWINRVSAGAHGNREVRRVPGRRRDGLQGLH
jgi:hypothetical protein